MSTEAGNTVPEPTKVGAGNTRTFRDTSEECAICLGSLLADPDFEGDDTTSTDGSDGGDHGVTLELKCGHVFHKHCVSEQLRHSQPKSGHRLLFTGTRCVKCRAACEHPALEHLSRATDMLRSRVDALIVEQLQVEHPECQTLFQQEDGDLTQGGTSVELHLQRQRDRENLLEQGRRNYSFYLCSSCEEPYFGGTVECAEHERGELPPDERLCPGCTTHSQSIGCTNPTEHYGHHVWKCRYCCQVATFVCHGSMHFCSSCHDRHSALERQGTTTGGNKTAPLEPIACPGRNQCPFPMVEGQDRHATGPTACCEQVYYCAWCRSSPTQRLAHLIHVEPGSRNLLFNPSGEHGLLGWTQLTSCAWQVERSDIPAPPLIQNDPTQHGAVVPTNFVSSFSWCAMQQTIPIRALLRLDQPSTIPQIEVSCQYMGRTDCPSVFGMDVLVLGSNPQQVLCRESIGPTDTSCDYWDVARLVVAVPPQAHTLVVIVTGKDQRFWAGNYGSKVANCTVRVLGSEEELRTLLVSNLEATLEHQHSLMLPQGSSNAPTTMMVPRRRWWQSFFS